MTAEDSGSRESSRSSSERASTAPSSLLHLAISYSTSPCGSSGRRRRLRRRFRQTLVAMR